MRLYEMGERLYISSAPQPRDVEKIQVAGINAILCLANKRTPEEVIETVQFWQHVHIPDSRKAVPVNALRDIVRLELRLLAEGYTLLVHCHQGRNRSVLAATLAERTRWSWSGREALNHARSIRPRSLYNPTFAAWLESLP